MSTSEGDPGAGGRQPTEEELRAAYEEEIKRVRVEHILLDQIVTMVNLGMRRTGLAPGTESERDPDQVRLAIESIRVLLPLVEQVAPEQAGPIRQALSQLQLAFVRIGGAATAPPADTPPAEAQPGPGASQPPPAPATPQAGPQPQEPPAKPGEPGPAQRSGRLWVPGQ
jgi:hypothetical protein